MKRNFSDITSKIVQEPSWWDENGVPRYKVFNPRADAPIGFNEYALLEIACQECGHRFLVAVGRSNYHSLPTLKSLIKYNQLEYGDPPNTDCCIAGATMTSIPIRVVEYWRQRKDILKGWKRIQNLEVVFTEPEPRTFNGFVVYKDYDVSQSELG